MLGRTARRARNGGRRPCDLGPVAAVVVALIPNSNFGPQELGIGAISQKMVRNRSNLTKDGVTTI
jgi:hypothetical protein